MPKFKEIIESRLKDEKESKKLGSMLKLQKKLKLQNKHLCNAKPMILVHRTNVQYMGFLHAVCVMVCNANFIFRCAVRRGMPEGMTGGGGMKSFLWTAFCCQK